MPASDIVRSDRVRSDRVRFFARSIFLLTPPSPLLPKFYPISAVAHILDSEPLLYILSTYRSFSSQANQQTTAPNSCIPFFQSVRSGPPL